MNQVIYYVEDEEDLRNIIEKYLIKEGYRVKTFSNGEEAISHLDDTVDLWLLDIMLPGDVSGYEIIQKLKEKESKASVIFTSARDQALDKIVGLEYGADDYIAKPVTPKELLLRVKSVLRRNDNTKTDIMNYVGYSINFATREVKDAESKIIELTNKEYEMLIFFLKNRNVQISREKILKTIWGDNYDGSERVVDDLLRRLRNKMPNINIVTIYGYGYTIS
ncbi:MAG: response regulator transcription factor [Acholeplasmatales bacterium]|jgi:two-component system response regulator CssR|nr:response regulator transcription factor [Acholeplasmatales bacterium]